ncbi:hypothetical protein BDZ94DRAFT_1313746 [Collybia nuda]|uniref:Uncharacterized protein n=1 Tax=Collybia nuda TaxID=64659 RepID=A0A9P5XYF9_9AGAR|nr:hypothetical protein BDZ94DRAFT_1313746 [Collybia nuda]
MASPTLTIPTFTLSSTDEPSGTAYVWSAPVTDREKFLSIIFGFSLLGILAIATISAFVYHFLIKPRKLRAAQRAAAANEDIERQNRIRKTGCPVPSCQGLPYWMSDSVIDVSSPPLTRMPPGRERSKKEKRPRIHNPESFR